MTLEENTPGSMRYMKSPVMKLAAVALAAAALGMAGCGNSDAATSVPEADGSVAAGLGQVQAPVEAVIIDVRTPEEFQAAHLDGAVNLDLNSGQFAQSIQNLDPEQTYLIYCRSGNRSAQATQLLRQAGFEKVQDLGSLEDAAAATGVTVVQ